MKYTHHKKIIKYQIVVDLQQELNHLRSWQQSLEGLYAYFNQDSQKDLASKSQDYYVQRLIFNDFYQENTLILARIQKRITLLKKSEAIKPVLIQ